MSSGEEPGTATVAMATYTGVWRIERKLYKIHDIDLPRPVAAGEAAAFVAAALLVAGLWSALGVPFNPWTGPFLYLAPTLVATWYVRRPVADAKTIPAYLATQLRYRLEPTTLDGLVPRRRGDEYRLTGRVHTPPAGLQPVLHCVTAACSNAVVTACSATPSPHRSTP